MCKEGDRESADKACSLKGERVCKLVVMLSGNAQAANLKP